MTFCNLCNRSFSSQESLKQHIRNSPAHKPPYCGLCGRSFGSQEALNQHVRDSSAHFQLPKTPLNDFFLSFPNFDFDPSLPPAESYACLQKFYGWERGDEETSQAWNDYQEALTEEFEELFGSEDDIGA